MCVAGEIPVEAAADDGIVKGAAVDVHIGVACETAIVVAAEDIAEIAASDGDVCVADKGRGIIAADD